MKKLMTMVAAVALACGLQAATEAFVFNQTDFSGANVGPLDLTENDNGGNTPPFYWAGDVGDSEIKAVGEGDGAPKFLAIENSNPLYRTVLTGPNANSQEIGTGVFADMFVKFTASDAADPVVLADGSKLGIWVAADDEADTPSTNLMVCAASLAAGWDTPVATNFTIALDADFDFTVEHRVTIRAIEEISTGNLGMAGFVIYIDEDLVAAADADYADKIGFTAFNSVAAPFYNNKQLFVSLVEAGTLSAQTIYGVGFKGTGELSKVALADADHAPEFAKPAVDVTFAWADGVESFTYQGIATNVGGKAGSVVVTLAGPTVPVTLSGVTVADDYVDGGIKADGLTLVEDGVWAYEASPASLTMKAAPVAFTIDGKKFATFEDALAAAKNGDTIKLAKNCVWTGEVEIDVGEDNEITLDLAGKTISADDYDDYDLFVVNSGKLTIIDSVGGGKIAVTGAEGSLYEGIVYGDGGEAQIGLDSDDADKGVVVDALIGTEAGSLTLIKGQFIKTLNEDSEDLENYLPEGDEYEVADAGDYWQVQKKGVEPVVKYTVTFTTNDAPYVVVNNVASNTAFATIKPADPDIKGYTLNGWDPVVEVIDGTELTFAAVLEPTTYSITYKDYGDWVEGFTPVTEYTITNETFLLPVKDNIEPSAGGTFKNWTNELGEVVAEVQKGTTGDLVFYAEWEAVLPPTYDITITPPENGTLETSVTNDVEIGTVVTVTATPAEGYELVSITTNGQVLAGTTFEMPAEDVTVAATFKQAGGGWDPTVDPTVPASAKGIEGKLANASFKDLSQWALYNNITFQAGNMDEYKDAFLLDCAPDGVEEAKKEFKFASITQDAEGNWVVTIANEKAGGQHLFRNGIAIIKRYSDVTCETEANNGNFFKATLEVYSVKVGD